MARGPYLQHADTGITVAWYTDSPTGGWVRWRADEGTAGEVASSAGPATRHEAVIAPLVPGARYAYRIYSTQGLLAAAGGEVEFAFRAPRPDVLRFVAFGDSGENSPGQHAVARAIAAEAVPPDLVIIVGDVNQPPPNGASPSAPDAAAYASCFFEPYRTLLPAIPFYALLGNHDYEVEKGRAFLDLFTLPRNGPPGLLPETSYWLERAGALLIVHDTNQSPPALEARSVPWHAEVAARPAAFRFVFQHHGLYSSGPNVATEPSGALRGLLAPLYTRTGVDVVFSGHDHFYERTRPIGGVVYVTTGAGGGALYPRTTWDAPTEAFVNDRHSYTHVEVRGRTMLLRQTDTDGRTIDSLTITKP
jgi:3',5'-cyclic AMP phosphodiesterase CpdA